MESFPLEQTVWMDDKGIPVHACGKGQVVSLDNTSSIIYQPHKGTNKKLSLRDKLVYLGDNLIKKEYRFKGELLLRIRATTWKTPAIRGIGTAARKLQWEKQQE